MEEKIPQERWLPFFLIILFSSLLLLARATDLMIIRGSYFRRLAGQNRIRRINLLAARGKILDKNDRILAQNVPKFFDGQELISRETALEFKAQGKEVGEELVREYPYKEATAHLLGYLSKVTEAELKEKSCETSYLMPDWVGRAGIEAEYECLLKGKPGQELIEVNSQEEPIRKLGKIDSQPGKDIRLTIDAWFQEKIYQEIKDKGQKMAVVALEPKSGSVLAMVSVPSFNANVFSLSRSETEINRLLKDSKNLPFLNRTIGGVYHPGSIFKIVTATAGLMEGEIDPETTVEDTGVIKIGEWSFANWYFTDYGRTEGAVDLIKAIKRSNDIYFYKLGEWLGVDKLADWARKFGLGKASGVDLPGEVAGLVPDPKWKEQVKGEKWFLGNTYHFAIGQGDLTMTPLQAALMTAVVANNGKMCRPHLINSGEINCLDLGIKESYLGLIKEGMAEACSEGGTGFPFFGFKPEVACKTGTAEVGDGTKDSHAWFTVFAPVDDPKIVLTILIERGGSGAYEAAPIAKNILQTWFNR